MRNKHHRKCKSNGGTRCKRNLSIVKEKEHVSFHNLFANADTYGIAEILNETWIDPDYKLLVVRR